jgi:hypothetical protein
MWSSWFKEMPAWRWSIHYGYPEASAPKAATSEPAML